MLFHVDAATLSPISLPVAADAATSLLPLSPRCCLRALLLPPFFFVTLAFFLFADATLRCFRRFSIAAFFFSLFFDADCHAAALLLRCSLMLFIFAAALRRFMLLS